MVDGGGDTGKEVTWQRERQMWRCGVLMFSSTLTLVDLDNHSYGSHELDLDEGNSDI